MTLHLYPQRKHASAHEKTPAIPMSLHQAIKKCPGFCNSCGGFTLLELLISLVMIGVMALIITGAFHTSVRTVRAGEKKIDHLERTRASFNIIGSQVQSQIPLTFEENGEKKYYFQGDKEYLQFPTNYSIWGGRNGYVMARYKVQPDDTGKLLLTVSENIIGTDINRESQLFSAADTLFFEYFFRDPTEEKGKWTDKWTDTAHIPEKIKLHLVYGENDISMIIPMRTAASLTQTPLIQTGRRPARTSNKERQGLREKAPK